jgi:class 3 adenylate cyclase
MKVHGADKRSKTFFRTGNALSILICSIFIFSFGAIFIETNFWKHTIFSKLPSLKNACQVEQLQADGDLKFAAIEIPHFGKDYSRPISPTQRQVRYKCRVDQSGNLTKAHFGWIRGSTIEVEYPKGHTLTFSGPEKLSIMIGEEREISIVARAPEGTAAIGLYSNFPPVVTESYKQSNRVEGIEIFLGVTRSINNILPILSLGLIICFAWATGFVSRTVTMALFVLVWATFYKGINVVMNLLGLDAVAFNGVSVLLRPGFTFATILLLMEWGRVFPKLIYPISRIMTFAIVSLCILTYMIGPLLSTSNIAIVTGAISAFSLLLITSKKCASDAAAGVWDKQWYLFTAIVAISSISDSIVESKVFFRSVEILIPFIISIYIIRDFSRSEKKYISEVEKKQEAAHQRDRAKSSLSIVSRFLPEHLVKSFLQEKDKMVDVEESLKRRISPAPTKVAVLQADIRGFSKFLNEHSAEDTINNLRAIFGPAVDVAQKFSMIKLVGDCLFAFVEETDTENAVDKAITIAACLLHSLEAAKKDHPRIASLTFGIAINYGDAIVGNLSSDYCIDYTVIGKTVNLTARMEEATKNPHLTKQTGENAVLLGVEAVQHTQKFAQASYKLVDTIEIRSFPEYKEVFYLTEEACKKLVSSEGIPIRETAPKRRKKAILRSAA